MAVAQRIAIGLALAGALLPATPAHAAGPLLVNGAGQALAWTTQPIPYNPDQGTLGAMNNADAVAFVDARFATWAGVATASISFTNAGALPADVTAANAATYLGVCGDNLNPVVFDTDGSIVRTLFGIGNENVILGAAGPDCGTFTPPAITEASAILNGRFIDGINTQLNPEIALTDFQAVFTHEFGHYIGLDHSQINLTEAFDGNPANDNAVATMFPILVNGAEQATLNLDDLVSVSMLYPAATFFASSGAIQGSVLRPDGLSPFQGAYMIARDNADPRVSAVGVVSGFLYAPNAAGGPSPTNLAGYYELDGLTPGASYTVEIEAVAPTFRGGSAIGPLDPPAVLAVPEFWNAANEAATNPPDDPTQASLVTTSAGVPVTGIDVIMNSASGALPPNDLCTQAMAVSTLPFSDTEDATGATESATDPSLSCTNGAESNTLWYAITPSSDGLLRIDTCGSSYNTALSVFTGTCAGPSPLTCNDDVSAPGGGCGGTDSRLSFDAVAGQTYLIEVAQRGSPAGGTLQFHAMLGPRDCLDGGCLPGRGGRVLTQCMAEFLIEPPLVFSGRPPATVTCVDGDACDLDGDATNHSCTFNVGPCLNNHDPNLVCTPSDVATVELLKPNRNGLRNKPEDTGNADAFLATVAAMGNSGGVSGLCLNQGVGAPCLSNADCNSPGKNDGRCYRFVRFTPALTAADRCGVSANLVVPLRRLASGTYRSVTKRLRWRVTSSSRVTDIDGLALRCKPAP